MPYGSRSRRAKLVPLEFDVPTLDDLLRPETGIRAIIQVHLQMLEQAKAEGWSVVAHRQSKQLLALSRLAWANDGVADGDGDVIAHVVESLVGVAENTPDVLLPFIAELERVVILLRAD